METLTTTDRGGTAVNWTAAIRRPALADRVVARDAGPSEQPLRAATDEDLPAALAAEERDPETTPPSLQARQVRAFTPREGYVPRHRANVPTDSVGERDGTTDR